MRVSTNQPMVSSQGLVQQLTFNKVPCKRGIWYIGQDPKNPAGNLYFAGDNKEGHGGAEMYFLLTNGSTDVAIGPWCSNARALFEDTGVDLREQHFIKYIVATNITGVKDTYGEYDCSGVLQDGMEGQIVSFDHADKQAQLHANALGKRVSFIRISSGGSCVGWRDPEC